MSALKTLVMFKNESQGDIIQPRKNPSLLFENISTTFSWSIFFKQLLIHLTPPLFIFWTNARNQEFMLSRPVEILNYLWPSLLYTMCAAVAVDYVYYDGFLIQARVLYMPLTFYVLQKFQIAVKYACLSKKEYDKFMSAGYDTALAYNSQMMLVPGWLFRPHIITTFELSSAAIRCGVDISTLDFIIPNPKSSKDKMSQFRNWKALLLGKSTVSDSDECPHLRLQADGTYLVSVFHTCEGLLKYSEAKHGGFVKTITKLAFMIALLNVILTFVALLYESDKLSNTALDITFYVSMAITLGVYTYLIYHFMVVTIYDILRQRHIFIEIRQMLRISDFHYYAKESTFVQEGNMLRASYVDVGNILDDSRHGVTRTKRETSKIYHKTSVAGRHKLKINTVISVKSKDATEIEGDYPEVSDLENNLTKQEIVTPKTLPSFLEFDSLKIDDETAIYINDNNDNLSDNSSGSTHDVFGNSTGDFTVTSTIDRQASRRRSEVDDVYGFVLHK